MFKHLLNVLTMALALSTSATFALPNDQNQPIHVSADSAYLNDKTGITTYKGNVVIKQGTLLIEGKHVEMHRNDDGLEKLIARGSPAHFRQQPNANEPYSDAWGDKMVYTFNNSILSITGKAKVIQNQDTFSGNRITYDIDRSIVNAFGNGSNTQKDGRVNVTIQPKQKKGSPAQ